MLALAADNRFRPAAVLLPERSASFPDVPTIAQAGSPPVNVVPRGSFVTPAATPKDVMAAANRALREAIAHPDTKGPTDKAGILLRPGRWMRSAGC